MKYPLFIFCFVTMLLSCSEKKEAKRIPLTSTSKEAIENYNQGVFRDEQLESDEASSYFKKALELDSNFAMAKIYFNDKTDPASNKKRLVEAYNNRASLSEIESVIVAVTYETTINNDFAKSDLMMDSLIKKYPDYYELYLSSADIKNMLNKTEDCLHRYKESLEVNPECYAAALSIPNLHTTAGNGFSKFSMLPIEKRNIEEAEKYFNLAAKIRPNAPATSRMYGNLYRAKADLDKALAKYEESINLNTEKTSLYSTSLLMVGHISLAKGEYDKSREFYQKARSASKNGSNGIVSLTTFEILTYLYEKKYDEVISQCNTLLSKIDSLPESEYRKNNFKAYIEYLKFITYGHSLKEQETLESISKIDNYRAEITKSDIEKSVDNNEIINIQNKAKSQNLSNYILYNILFAHYEEAEKKLKELESVLSETLKKNPTAMDDFYKFSGYLSLMEGKVKESVDFYKKVVKGLDEDTYDYYFYGLALKAQGNKVESDQIFTKITKNYFVQWQIAIVKELAKAQLNASN
ncbi:MAG: hypothetical protein WCG74_03820 [Sediminibacterium sp.]